MPPRQHPSVEHVIRQHEQLSRTQGIAAFTLHLKGPTSPTGAVPTAVSWWLAQIVCVALMTVLGEYLCMRTELKAIPVSIGGLASSLGVGPKSDL